MVAWCIYVVGGVLALRYIVAGLTGDGIYEWFAGVALGVAFWWIATGFGVRLGVTPNEFARSIAHALGFGREAEREFVDRS